MEIWLDSLDKVKKFVITMSGIDGADDIDLISGNYTIDARSLLGILSLDLSKPLKVEFNGNEKYTEIEKKLYEFKVDREISNH